MTDGTLFAIGGGVTMVVMSGVFLYVMMKFAKPAPEDSAGGI